MTVIEELTDLVRTAHDSRSRRGRHDRQPGPRHRLRRRTGQGAHQRPQPARPHHPGELRRRPRGAGHRHRQRPGRRPRRPRRRHRRHRTAHLGGRGADHRRRGRHRDRRTASPSRDLGTGDRNRGRVRGSARPTDHRRARALGAVRARLVRGARARPRRPRRRHQHPPPRVRLLPRACRWILRCATSWTGWPAAARSSLPTLAWRWRRPNVAARLRAAVGLTGRDGLLVREVADGSPAAKAGITRGDLLVRAGDRDLRTTDDLFAVLGGISTGDQLVLGVVRGVEELDVTVTF